MRKMLSLVPPLLLLPLLLLLLLPPLPPVCGRGDELRHASYIQIWSTKYNWSWTEARRYCMSDYTDIVAIRTEEENQWLVPFSGAIGLNRRNPNKIWKWRQGDNATFFSWAPGEPQDSYNCVYKNSGSDEWFVRNCFEWKYFICYEDQVILVKEKKSWEEALAHCRALKVPDSTGPTEDGKNHHYDLVSILSADDLAFAHEKAEGATTDEVWTGLRFLAGRWFWVDGQPVQAGQKIPSEPSPESFSSCGALGVRRTEPIQATDCALKKNFFCRKKIEDWFIEIV